jgi:serine/threonine protein kinase/formylglycine-generating enzyme required for sulfatase activity
MLESWAKAYADRWGLPQPAVSEILRVMDAVRRGDVADGRADTRIDEEDTNPPLTHHQTLDTASLPPEERYEEMGMIGEGGMGEVRRVWDNALQRTVAMKILRRDLSERDDLVHRFVEEAQATAQLEHPGIMPVYDVGRLRDGRPYFTMKEIRGRSLLDVIEEVHQESTTGWGVTPTGWTFQRLIQVLQQVCEAVAFAHSRGVLHRDLKPTNVMVGAFGEVVVMDWGLAKISQSSGSFGSGPKNPVVTVRSRGGLYVTRSGSVAGTPNYMPPEQARGEHGLVGPWSDVYALGALLYEVLADRAPYDGDDLDEVVRKVLAAAPPPPYPRFQSADHDLPYPEDGLRAICAKAMARDIVNRYMDAATLAEAIRQWLDNAGARERAIELVRRADTLDPDMVSLRKRVATLRADAASILATLPADAPADQKRAGWALEDQATDIEQELVRKQVRYANYLQAALAGVPDLPEAQGRLEALAETSGTALGQGPLGAALVRPTKPGDGFLTLLTEPPGARVTLRRFELVDRRLVPRMVPGFESTARSPIDRMRLPAGSWQVYVEADGFEPLVVLAHVRPGELWSTNPAGTTRAVPIRLAVRGSDPEGAVRVPPGWAWMGGDIELRDSLPRTRVWVDGFLIQRSPVSVADVLLFLQELESTQRRDAAERLAPSGFTLRSGRWTMPEGWSPDEPARRIPFDTAHAYAAWFAGRTGRPWRLPREREWEKAARGVDERIYPWGGFLDPSWACVAESHAGRPPRPHPVSRWPLDVSPYGVLSLAGNVRDWVIDDRAPRPPPGHPEPAAPEHRWVKGGHYLGIAQLARSALRYRLPVPWDEGTGFRLVASLP